MVEKICHLLRMMKKFNPIRDDKYITAKLKIFNKINRTTFTNNIVPIEKIIILVFLQ